MTYLRKAVLWLSVIGIAVFLVLGKYFKTNPSAQHEYYAPKAAFNRLKAVNFPVTKTPQSVTKSQQPETEQWNAATTVSSNDFNPGEFNISGTDVIVFLHIQKTGGSTFGRHLVRDIKLAKECVKSGAKRHDCFRPNSDRETWLFSRFTTGWRCGLHADWTSLQECVPSYFERKLPPRKFYYVTILRNPISRYISEWAHVARGATWKSAYLKCNGEKYDLPNCWKTQSNTNISLEEFTNCSSNLADNRQMWMLADLRLINCTGEGLSEEEQGALMLESAKKNLQDMPFFGLTELQSRTQKLFEYTFRMKFNMNFTNIETKASAVNISDENLRKVKALNKLDVELYRFAQRLFNKRYQQFLKANATGH